MTPRQADNAKVTLAKWKPNFSIMLYPLKHNALPKTSHRRIPSQCPDYLKFILQHKKLA